MKGHERPTALGKEAVMATPIIFTSKHGIQEGKVEQAKESARKVAELLKENHPSELYFGIFVDEAEEVIRVLQVHPDEESQIKHLELIGEHLASAWDFLEPGSIDVYGPASDELKQMLTQAAQGASVRFHRTDATFARLDMVCV